MGQELRKYRNCPNPEIKTKDICPSRLVSSKLAIATTAIASGDLVFLHSFFPLSLSSFIASSPSTTHPLPARSIAQSPWLSWLLLPLTYVPYPYSSNFPLAPFFNFFFLFAWFCSLSLFREWCQFDYCCFLLPSSDGVMGFRPRGSDFDLREWNLLQLRCISCLDFGDLIGVGSSVDPKLGQVMIFSFRVCLDFFCSSSRRTRRCLSRTRICLRIITNPWKVLVVLSLFWSREEASLLLWLLSSLLFLLRLLFFRLSI